MAQENAGSLAERLQKIATTRYSEQDAYLVREALNDIVAEVVKKPALLTVDAQDILTSMAFDSPHRDIHGPEREVYHPQTPGQDKCLYTVRALGRLAAFVSQTCDIGPVDRLEAVATASLDFDVRKEALMSLWHLSIVPGVEGRPASDVLALNEKAFGALLRQSQNNDHPDIRMAARDLLFSAAADYNKGSFPTVFATLLDGTKDKDATARLYAYARLSNIVQSTGDLSVANANTLKSAFERATQPGEDEKVAGMAKLCTEQLQARLANGNKPPYPRPVR